MDAPTVGDTGHADDLAAIKQVVADLETAFNTNDPDLMTAHFAANATAVNVMGVRIDGWDAMLAANRDGLAGFLRDQYARYEVADVLFLRPDVALAHKQAYAVSESGEPIDVDHSMKALYVLVKEQGRWWIAARQNTLVPR